MTRYPSECEKCEVVYFTDSLFQLESVFWQFKLDRKADPDVITIQFIQYIDEKLKDIHKDHG